MKILDENDIELLDIMVKNEIEFIHKGFKVSELLGKLFISNSISSFVNNHLKNTHGKEILPQFSSEYRYFIVGLLKNINDEFKEVVTREILIPTVKKTNNEELLTILVTSLHTEKS